MPVPLLGWNAPRADWLKERRGGLGASDVSAALGFSTRRTPWQVAAEKTSLLLPPDDAGPAAQLGTDLEPWIIEQAPKLLGMDVARTPHMLYAHDQHPWRRCSPDAFSADGWCVQAKTSGLATPGYPQQWSDGGIPLDYELQVRWEIHVMDAPGCHLVALVAGQGLIHRPVERDMGIEHALIAQVDPWWKDHVIDRKEPALMAPDTDMMKLLFPCAIKPEIDLTHTPIEHWVAEYVSARDDEKDAKTRKDEAGANVKRLIGDATVAKSNGRKVATWSSPPSGKRALYI